jgi:hypothetical protein
MEPVQHALSLLRRQSELENAMRRPGGIRLTEERDLYQLREALSRFPAAVTSHPGSRISDAEARRILARANQ